MSECLQKKKLSRLWGYRDFYKWTDIVLDCILYIQPAKNNLPFWIDLDEDKKGQTIYRMLAKYIINLRK